MRRSRKFSMAGLALAEAAISLLIIAACEDFISFLRPQEDRSPFRSRDEMGGYPPGSGTAEELSSPLNFELPGDGRPVRQVGVTLVGRRNVPESMLSEGAPGGIKIQDPWDIPDSMPSDVPLDRKVQCIGVKRQYVPEFTFQEEAPDKETRTRQVTSSDLSNPAFPKLPKDGTIMILLDGNSDDEAR